MYVPADGEDWREVDLGFSRRLKEINRLATFNLVLLIFLVTPFQEFPLMSLLTADAPFHALVLVLSETVTKWMDECYRMA